MSWRSILSGLVPGRKREEVKVHYYGHPKREAKPTIRVLMLKDAVGAPDGITRTDYKAGEQYELPEDLAGCFFSSGEADPAEAHAQPAERAEPPDLTLQGGVIPATPSAPVAEKAAVRPRAPRRKAP